MVKRYFYGWTIVLAAHILLGVIFGAAYSFGAFFTQLERLFTAERSMVAAIFSLTALTYYILGVFSGSLADRFSTRLVVSLGIVSLALGFALGSLLGHSLSGFLWVHCALVGIGVGLVYIPTVTIIQRWFIRQRSKASGLALAGTGLGTFIGPISAGLLLEHFSWATTMQIFAFVIALVGLTAARYLRDSPAQLGLLPDGDLAPSTVTGFHPAPDTRSLPLHQAIRSARFWWYFAGIFLGSIGLFVAIVHISPYAQQHGLSSSQGNALIGLIGVGNVLGRLFLGGLGDKLGAHRLLCWLNISLALLALGWLSATSWLPLALFALLFGVANGGCISLYPAVAANWYGTAYLGAVLGALYIAVGFAAIVGGSIAGYLFDLSQSYYSAILLAASSAVLAVFCLWLANQPKTIPATNTD